MGKGKDTGHGSSEDALVAVDEVCEAFHEASQTLRQAALRILMMPAPTGNDHQVAGAALVAGERMRIIAGAVRVQYGEPDESPASPAPSAPKRTRGPRKPRQGSLLAPDGPGVDTGNLQHATTSLKASNDRLEASTAPRANGGAS